jgi:hypothetical protein
MIANVQLYLRPGMHCRRQNLRTSPVAGCQIMVAALATGWVVRVEWSDYVPHSMHDI